MSSVGEPDPQATSFGAFAGAYAALRPTWPARTASWLIGEPAAGRRLRVIDLGAGTGKLTETLVGLGHEVVAVDPSGGMLEQLRRRVAGVDVRAGSAEAIPVVDASVDAVAVAQAWHWFDQETAAAECARVLRPGGVLGVAWHQRDESVSWVRELAEAVGRMQDVGRRPRGGRLVLGPPFDTMRERVFEYSMTTTPDGLRDLADTWSYVHLAPDREARLGAVLAIGRRVAEPDGTLVIPHRTHCFRACLRWAPPLGGA